METMPANLPKNPAPAAVRLGAGLLGGLYVVLASGCVSYVGGLAADTLSSAILNQTDPIVVQSGLPAYLLIVDGFIVQNPDRPAMLSAGADCFHCMARGSLRLRSMRAC